MPLHAERAARPRAKSPAAAGPQRRPPAPQRPPLWHVLQLRAARAAEAEAAPSAPTRGDLPASLKTGVERLSGLAMGDVRVHRNSPEPAKLGALAYTQGSDIHLGPGQEAHLPHEAWHVVQQKQGRVQATAQLRTGIAVNRETGLEREADHFGALALASPEIRRPEPASLGTIRPVGGGVVQGKALQDPPDMVLSKDQRDIHFTVGGSLAVHYWTKQLPTLYDTRSQLLSAIANQAAAVGSSVQRQVSGISKRTGLPVEHWIPNASEADTDSFNYKPMRISFSGTYKVPPKHPPLLYSTETLEIDYHLGSVASGYVVRVNDSAGKSGAREMEPDPKAKLTGNKYSPTHEKPGSDVLASLNDNPDATSKVAGEGARWRAVRENAAKLQDKSWFYTNDLYGYPFTTFARGIVFHELYLIWKSAFQKEYDIDNQTIVAVLQYNAIPKSAGNGVVVVAPFPIALMDVGRDVCLDTLSPSSKDQLEERAAVTLHHVAPPSFAKAFAEEAKAVTEKFGSLVEPFGNVAYTKGGTFSFGAVTKKPFAKVAGENGVLLDKSYCVFPAYRTDKAAYAKTLIALKAGDPAFAEDQKAFYVSLIDSSVLALQNAFKTPRVPLPKESAGLILTSALKLRLQARFAWDKGPLPDTLLAQDKRQSALDEVAREIAIDAAKPQVTSEPPKQSVPPPSSIKLNAKATSFTPTTFVKK